MRMDRDVSTWGATRKSLKGAGAVCLAVLAVAQAGAQGPIELSNVVAGTNGFAMDGVAMDESHGKLGVGRRGCEWRRHWRDLVVGAYAPGRTFVVFGKSGGTATQLSALVSGGSGQGFVIEQQTPGWQTAYSVAIAGDVNGDGLADVIIGAPNTPSPGGSGGRSYVVFGKTSDTPVLLSSLVAGANTQGFILYAALALDRSGACVAAAGDVNGDGLGDVLVSSPTTAARRARARGLWQDIRGVRLSYGAGQSGQHLGIPNQRRGDGPEGRPQCVVRGRREWRRPQQDLILGCYSMDPGSGAGAGRSYVVLGKSGGALIGQQAANGAGFVINGEAAGDNAGRSVSSAGDVNGDGLADLLVGASGVDTPAANAGRAYVVFGTTGTNPVALSNVTAGAGGFAINRSAAADAAGRSVSSVGDVNGDGLADVLVGAPNGDPGGNSLAGSAYLVFGTTNTTPIELSQLAAGSSPPGFQSTAGQAIASGWTPAASPLRATPTATASATSCWVPSSASTHCRRWPRAKATSSRSSPRPPRRPPTVPSWRPATPTARASAPTAWAAKTSARRSPTAAPGSISPVAPPPAKWPRPCFAPTSMCSIHCPTSPTSPG